jgi:hypothetical protein
MSIFRTPASPTPIAVTPRTGAALDLDDQDDQLTDDELAQLREAEARIQRGLSGFLDMGLALGTIRERRLFRATHGSWEGYLLDRWKMTADYSQKLITAVKIVSELRDAGIVVMPVREVHARRLNLVDPTDRPKVWEAALAEAGGDPEAVTADRITALAGPRLSKGRKKKSPKPPAAIKLRGRGWTITLERKRDDVDAEAALAEAQDQLRDRLTRRAA